MSAEHTVASGIEMIEGDLISFFQDGARMLGLPKSLGEIYGLLYVSKGPLTMLELIERLQISKGSASQGLRMLKTLGAVTELNLEDDRKTYFEANRELKKLVGGFIREEIRPHLKSGKNKIAEIQKQLANIDDPEERAFYQERFHKLDRWATQANVMLPFVQKFLGE